MFRRYLKYIYTVLIAAAIIMFITYNSKDIESGGSTLTKNNIQHIFKYLNGKEYYKSYTFDSSSITIEVGSNADFNIVKNMEHDSSILFSLLDNLTVIKMEYKKEYIFNFEHLNKVFSYQLKEKKAFEIDNYYESLKEEYIYLGNINGMYNVYDTSDICHDDYQLLYTKDNYQYEMRCADINKVLLVDNNSNNYNLVDALTRNLVSPDDLITYNLDVIKKEI